MTRWLPMIAVGVLGTLVLLPWALAGPRLGYGFLDAQVAFWCVADDGTLYGDGFTEERFRSVEVGMSREDVRRLLGEPIVRPWHQGAHGDPSAWWYAFQRRAGTNAHRRCILFGADGRVSGCISEPHVD